MLGIVDEPDRLKGFGFLNRFIVYFIIDQYDGHTTSGIVRVRSDKCIFCVFVSWSVNKTVRFQQPSSIIDLSSDENSNFKNSFSDLLYRPKDVHIYYMITTSKERPSVGRIITVAYDRSTPFIFMMNPTRGFFSKLLKSLSNLYYKNIRTRLYVVEQINRRFRHNVWQKFLASKSRSGRIVAAPGEHSQARLMVNIKMRAKVLLLPTDFSREFR